MLVLFFMVIISYSIKIHSFLKDLKYEMKLVLNSRIDYPLPVAKEWSHKCKRDWHQEPEGQECQQGCEGNGSTWSLVPEDQVHYEEQSKHDPEMKCILWFIFVLQFPFTI